MARAELKTTQDLEKEIGELDKRVEAVEDLPLLRSLPTRLFILESLGEAVFQMMSSLDKREVLRHMQSISAGESGQAVGDNLTGRTVGQELVTYIGHLRSISGLRQ